MDSGIELGSVLSVENLGTALKTGRALSSHETRRSKLFARLFPALGTKLAPRNSYTPDNRAIHETIIRMAVASDTIIQHKFRLPTGLLGRLAGWYMSRENRHMNQMAVDWLDVYPDDEVLEIGFGPGHGLELLLATTTAKSVTGLDLSAEMAEQALHRNRDAANEGRLRIFVGAVEELPFADGQFSRVVAVSNFHVWPSRSQGLKEIHRVLRTEGKLVIALRRALERPWPWSSPGLSLAALRKDQELLESEGFRNVQLATRKHRRRNCCLVATI